MGLPSYRRCRKLIYTTARLIIRPLTSDDIPTLKLILQDETAMFAYEHAFSDEEVTDWLNKQLQNYAQFGYGLWAVVLKDGGAVIGQCGLTPQLVHQQTVTEIGYLFQRDYWHHGYATEAARGAKQYAFEHLGLPTVYSIIRDNNLASMNVAIRNGMQVTDRVIKHYYGITMPHYVFAVSRSQPATSLTIN